MTTPSAGTQVPESAATGPRLRSTRRHGAEDEPTVRVAEFASRASIRGGAIYVYIAALAAALQPLHDTGPTQKLSIEMKRKFGDLPYHMTRQLGFRRWHQWGHGFDKKDLQRAHDLREARSNRLVSANEWSRPLLLSAYQYAVKERVGGGQIEVAGRGNQEPRAEDHAFRENPRGPRIRRPTTTRIFAVAQSYWTLMNQSSVMSRTREEAL